MIYLVRLTLLVVINCEASLTLPVLLAVLNLIGDLELIALCLISIPSKLDNAQKRDQKLTTVNKLGNLGNMAGVGGHEGLVELRGNVERYLLTYRMSVVDPGSMANGNTDRW